jgi:1-phosphofructokinase/tagatose 6-phosphate kinase
MILCVAANPSVDRLCRVESLHPGEIHRPIGLSVVPGGKGLNCARAAALLGGSVTAATLLAGHAGRFVAELVETEGVALEAVWAREGETRTSYTVAPEDGPLTEFYERGDEVAPDVWEDFAALVRRLATAADWMTISGSLPPGAPGDGYVGLIGAARTAFDSAEAGVEGRPALVKVNGNEARRLTHAADPLEAARILAESSAGAAVVTLGEEGAVAVDEGGGEWAVTIDARGWFPVGSGDCFLAGMVVALDRGEPFEDALRLATGAAAANAEQPGAALFDRARAEELAGAAVVKG